MNSVKDSNLVAIAALTFTLGASFLNFVIISFREQWDKTKITLPNSIFFVAMCFLFAVIAGCIFPLLQTIFGRDNALIYSGIIIGIFVTISDRVMSLATKEY